MLIFCTPFNQVILNFQISFFNAKSNCQLPKTNHCQQLLDTFDSSVVFVNHCINKGIHG